VEEEPLACHLAEGLEGGHLGRWNWTRARHWEEEDSEEWHHGK
jgi:hypothetical protein